MKRLYEKFVEDPIEVSMAFVFIMFLFFIFTAATFFTFSTKTLEGYYISGNAVWANWENAEDKRAFSCRSATELVKLVKELNAGLDNR